MVARGKNFNAEELRQLCFSFLEISQDPCVGSGQKKECFWERVGEHYERNKPGQLMTRSVKSLESKWGPVQKATTRFIACRQAIVDLKISGLNDEEIFKKAKELYKKRHPKNQDFTDDECYYILKECPRWMLPEDQMAKGKEKGSKKQPAGIQRTTSNGTEVMNKDNNPLSEDSEIQSDTEPVQKDNCTSSVNGSKRPQGSKQAKESMKKARSAEDAMKVSAQAQKESAQAQKLMAETGLQRLRVLESQTFMNMLTLPTAHLDLETQDFMAVWKKAEMTKLKERFTPPPPSPVPPTASRSLLPTPVGITHEEESTYDASRDDADDGAYTRGYSEWED